jgi:RNA polymerase sigma-70 factor (ECF subfamily)
MMSDDQILELIRHSNTHEKGFRLMVEAYQERLYWHVRRMVIDHEEANDVLQNTFIKVYKNIGKFKGNSALYTWLYRIATNESLTFLQKKKRHVTSSMDELEGLSQKLEADTYFDGNRAEKLLYEALENLPEKQRLVFQMRYFEDMSYKDISDVLGTTEGGLKASLHHAVKKIESFVKAFNV